MYPTSFHEEISKLEAFIFEGPETVEKIFEREEFFHGHHVNRNSVEHYSSDANSEVNQGSRNPWFRTVLHEDGSVERVLV